MNIKDIAQMAGVSTSTVSKILNNKDSDISNETRKKVLSIIKEYQYVPFSKVRKNAPLKSNLVGLLITEQVHNLEEFISGVESVVAQNGYSVIVCNARGDINKIKKYMTVLIGKNVEGILWVGDSEVTIEKSVIPIVFINANEKHRSSASTPHVYYDMKEAGEKATEYLISHGHQRIGCLLLEEDIAVETGYTRALYKHDIMLEQVRVYKGIDERDIGTIGMDNCQKMDVTALVCGNTKIAYCVYKALQDRGVVIPDEMSIITVRDDSLAEILGNGMSAINIPDNDIGSIATKMLIELIETKKNEYSMIKLPLTLIERNSVVAPPANRQGEKIVVVGSMNVDVTISVPSIPTDGETVMSSGVSLIPGGKGANQAVGAGKLGGLVYMIGRLGNDSDGKDLYNNLIKSNVKAEGIVFDSTLTSGKAYINVASDGESTIVVYPGANQNLDRNQIRQFKYLFKQARYCLLSLEIPIDTAEYVINTCNKKGVGVILKPSGVERIKDEMLEKLEYFIPNAKELKQLVPGNMSVEDKAQILLDKGVKNVIVTLGKKGCYLKNGEYSKFFSSADFTPLDTTGGADAFISALAVYLSEGNDILHAVGFATYAAGISITRAGVQPALPDRIAVDVYQDDVNAFITYNK